MRALQVSKNARPSEALEVVEVDVPEPGPGQVQVALRAAGLNFIDVYFRTGLYPRPLPFVSGLEGAGVVRGVGAGVTGLQEGDRVAWAAALEHCSSQPASKMANETAKFGFSEESGIHAKGEGGRC